MNVTSEDRIRFSLRHILILVAIIAVLLAAVLAKMRSDQEARIGELYSQSRAERNLLFAVLKQRGLNSELLTELRAQQPEIDEYESLVLLMEYGYDSPNALGYDAEQLKTDGQGVFWTYGRDRLRDDDQDGFLEYQDYLGNRYSIDQVNAAE